MVYNDTTDLQGIIQDEESNCELGVGGISGDTNLLKEFTRHNNKANSKIWAWIYFSCGGWQYDDGNQTNLPQATQNITAGTYKYALPTDALTVIGVSVYDGTKWKALTPTSDEKIKVDGALGEFGKNSADPSEYRLIGGTIILNNIPITTVTNGLKVYFDRGSVAFAYTATTVTPGFASEFHYLISVGGSIEWLKVHKPNSAVLTILQGDWLAGEQKITKFYQNRFKNMLPHKLVSKQTSSK